MIGIRVAIGAVVSIGLWAGAPGAALAQSSRQDAPPVLPVPLPPEVIATIPKPLVVPGLAGASRAEMGRMLDRMTSELTLGYHVFMSGRDRARVQRIQTQGCSSEILFDGGRDRINWVKGDVDDFSRTFTQNLGFRNAAGTLASLAPYMPGVDAFKIGTGKTYARQFEAMTYVMQALEKDCAKGG